MSRGLLVVNYPTLSAETLEKIQSVRQQHDLLYYDVVAPHFTLVFPICDRDEKSFIAHVEQVMRSIPSLIL